jgi:nucleotide-binding universal stress UspA family protein
MTGQTGRASVMIAIDDHPSNATTLQVGVALGRALERPVVATHVAEAAPARVRSAAERCGVDLQSRSGPVVPTLTAVVADTAVWIAVVGRGQPARVGRPAGDVALALIEATSTPTVLVPPDTSAGIGTPLHTVLLPLDGAPETEAAVAPTVRLLAEAALEVVVVHVLADQQVPAFLDQAHHDLEAWGHEFLARHAVTDTPPRIVLRAGTPGRNLLEVARAEDADLIVVGWSQDLSPGRADVVRLLLADAHVPVLLVPIEPSGAAA